MSSTMLTATSAVRSTEVGLSDATGIISDSDDNSLSADELEQKLPHSTSAKRSITEHLNDDPEQGQASKKRRKQSKPVRIATLSTTPAERDDSEDEHEGNEEGKGDSNEPSPTSEEVPISYPLVTDVLNSNETLIFSVDHVNGQSQFQHPKPKADVETLRNVRSDISVYPNTSKSCSTSPIDVIVGSWMSELHSKAEESLNGTKPLPNHSPTDVGLKAPSGASSPFNDRALVMPGYLPLGPSPYLVSVLSQGTGQNPTNLMSQQSFSQNPIRIFNPDAYCELCNKEFCNKYFLKTHKANKHGIYADSPSYPPTGTSIPGSPYAASFIATSMTTPPMSVLPLTKQAHPAKPGSLTSQPVELESASTSEGAMRANCDICQKKFCNKYFVRRHKVKVHGIVDDSIDSEDNGSPNPETVLKQDCYPSSTSAGSDAGSNVLEIVKIETHAPEIESSHSNAQGKDRAQHQSRHSPDHSEAEEGEETSVRTLDETHWVQNGVGTAVASTPIKHDGELSVDRLRRLGVINVDAFCEICCKEYCNKYFLRTHKMKRHGILIVDADGKDGRLMASGSGSWSSQTSPLNLIVAEQGTNSSDSGGKIRTEISDGEDPECDICGRRFQSTYLMQMHRAYLHSNDKLNDPSREDSSEENVGNPKDQSESEAGQLNNSGDFKMNGGKNNVSADLQKLQTMILQLNNLNVSQVTTCTICNKDLEHCYFLRAHMMTEHGVLFEENNGFNGLKQHSSGENSPSDSPPPSSPSQTFCYICKKDYFAKYFLKQHMDEFHGLPVPPAITTAISLVNDKVKEEFDTSDTLDKTPTQIISPLTSDKRVSLTPTSSYCEICNKELCNKYFMKTHMQRMHGIEIENGAQIGGVICDICNKELCSKYFLRVHKQNTHGIVEEGSTRDSIGIHTNGVSLNPPLSENDQALKPSDLGDLGNRYFTHFTEVCSFCNRRFRSSKWLKAHLMNDHGEAGIGKWKELELQYHLQRPKQTNNKSPGNSNNVQFGPGLNHSPTLKIPSSWGTQDQAHDSSTEQTGDVRSQEVLSSLFGAGETTGKSYDCSYCSFSTPVLSFLFVHERCHTGVSSQSIPDPSKPFQCPVCLQSFLQMESLQQHILTHQFSGLLNPFFTPTTASTSYPQSSSSTSAVINKNVELSTECQPQIEVKEQLSDADADIVAIVERDSSAAPGSKNKFRCSRCFQRFRSRELCLIHVQSKHGPKCNEPLASSASETENILITPQGLHKCMWCNFASPHSSIVKKHIRREHRVASSHHEIRYEPDTESWLDMKDAITDEVKKKLQDAAGKSQIPASYAVPQKHLPHSNRFIMQPFLLEEPQSPHDPTKLQLVPSLVFLPVKEKLSEPLTLSLTVTPA